MGQGAHPTQPTSFFAQHVEVVGTSALQYTSSNPRVSKCFQQDTVQEGLPPVSFLLGLCATSISLGHVVT